MHATMQVRLWMERHMHMDYHHLLYLLDQGHASIKRLFKYGCRCSLFLLPGFKLCNYLSFRVTIRLVLWPVDSLAFTGAISYTSASTAIHCYTALRHCIRKSALLVVAISHLCNILHFFVLLIQARAGDAVLEEFDKCVNI